MVSRAVGLSRADGWMLVGSTNDGDSWNVSTPKVCSTTLPTSAENGAAERLRGPRRQDVGLRLVGVLQRAQLRRHPSRAAAPDVAEEQRQDVRGRQRRIGVERRPQLLARPRKGDRHAIGLARDAHAGFGLDVEKRLDPRRVR